MQRRLILFFFFHGYETGSKLQRLLGMDGDVFVRIVLINFHGGDIRFNMLFKEKTETVVRFLKNTT